MVLSPVLFVVATLLDKMIRVSLTQITGARGFAYETRRLVCRRVSRGAAFRLVIGKSRRLNRLPDPTQAEGQSRSAGRTRPVAPSSAPSIHDPWSAVGAPRPPFPVTFLCPARNSPPDTERPAHRPARVFPFKSGFVRSDDDRQRTAGCDPTDGDEGKGLHDLVSQGFECPILPGCP